MDNPSPFLSKAFLAGSWVEASRTFSVRSPATGSLLAEVADCGAAEARIAIESAAEIFPQWKSATAYVRSNLLRQWHGSILRDAETLARTMVQEMGKPIAEARREVLYAASFVEWYAEEAKRIYGETVPSQHPHKRILVRSQPVGPVYGITPWNFPAAMVTRKVAPALAAGCPFVLKPAEQSPLTALLLARLWEESGGWPALFQVLPSSDPESLSAPFLADSRVRKLTFTGSTPVGKRLYEGSASTLKRVSLELGGGAPFLVFADADLEKAADGAITAKFRNGGQSCVAANAFYLQKEIAREFTRLFADRVASLRLGDPLDERTQVGPLVNAQGLAKVRDLVEDALARGAKTILGGPSHELFFPPTILAEIGFTSRILEEEAFGPVAPVCTFDSEEEALTAARRGRAGLAAYLWTRDLERALRFAEEIPYGIVGINDALPSTAQAPFGGFRESGLGREGGKWGLAEYLEPQYLSLGLD
ncbi:NAD-dependent succinate-semialdehyde dehydrogenase [Verrucomicrobium sp. 3C]|uniref:NAD-dependent succinate-semialdehyde dehydrogenase n=1 Tax=Verrucomicrobium sp. 3C TaxID=1134055 RepID=UPI0003A8FACD|nr:NAD-dependent succinate-semialdehyde dehydrogenase [Verrucomicrobium sp. 3C]